MGNATKPDTSIFRRDMLGRLHESTIPVYLYKRLADGEEDLVQMAIDGTREISWVHRERDSSWYCIPIVHNGDRLRRSAWHFEFSILGEGKVIHYRTHPKSGYAREKVTIRTEAIKDAKARGIKNSRGFYSGFKQKCVDVKSALPRGKEIILASEAINRLQNGATLDLNIASQFGITSVEIIPNGSQPIEERARLYDETVQKILSGTASGLNHANYKNWELALGIERVVEELNQAQDHVKLGFRKLA